jgi:hypothetical protein
MKLIYVAGPYTADTYSGIEDNIKKAEAVSIQLFQRGWNVFTPHKNTSHYEMYESVTDLNYMTWIKTTADMLFRCDAIFLMKNWQKSAGAIKEKECAISLSLPLFYGIEGIPGPEDMK